MQTLCSDHIHTDIHTDRHRPTWATINNDDKQIYTDTWIYAQVIHRHMETHTFRSRVKILHSLRVWSQRDLGLHLGSVPY